MKRIVSLAASAASVFLWVGCQSLPPGAEPGPHGTMAYDVLIEASEPGAKVEANGEIIGSTPLHLKIFGDTDGTFHDFGSPYYVVRGLALTTNQYSQTRVFQTGHMMSSEDRIPQRIYFDMSQPPPASAPTGVPVYGYPAPAPYYGPYYYGPGYYYGPEFRFRIGPGYRRHW